VHHAGATQQTRCGAMATTDAGAELRGIRHGDRRRRRCGWKSATHRQGEIGYTFHRTTTQGIRGGGWPDLQRLGIAAVGFTRSRALRRPERRLARLMERLGMRREAHLVENEWFKGEWGSELVYAMLDREWRARQG